MITSQFIASATGASIEKASALQTVLINAMERFEITSHNEICGFLSQIGVESGGLNATEENLNYRVSALLSLFGRSRISEEDANAYGRNDTTGQKANQEMLANILYGGEFGRKNLGNTEFGDGWKYRGRGYKQLTGKYNYGKCGEAIGMDLINQPELLIAPEAAALSAAWFWSNLRGRGIAEAAEANDVVKMTKLINGGDIGLKDRQRLFAAAQSAWEA